MEGLNLSENLGKALVHSQNLEKALCLSENLQKVLGYSENMGMASDIVKKKKIKGLIEPLRTCKIF